MGADFAAIDHPGFDARLGFQERAGRVCEHSGPAWALASAAGGGCLFSGAAQAAWRKVAGFVATRASSEEGSPPGGSPHPGGAMEP